MSAANFSNSQWKCSKPAAEPGGITHSCGFLAVQALWYDTEMETSPLQLTTEMRAALIAHPGEALHIADKETGKVYVVLEQGAVPELEEEFIRARLEEGFAAIERGEEEEWDTESIKAEGRRILQQRQSQQ